MLVNGASALNRQAPQANGDVNTRYTIQGPGGFLVLDLVDKDFRQPARTPVGPVFSASPRSGVLSQLQAEGLLELAVKQHYSRDPVLFTEQGPGGLVLHRVDQPDFRANVRSAVGPLITSRELVGVGQDPVALKNLLTARLDGCAPVDTEQRVLVTGSVQGSASTVDALLRSLKRLEASIPTLDIRPHVVDEGGIWPFKHKSVSLEIMGPKGRVDALLGTLKSLE